MNAFAEKVQAYTMGLDQAGCESIALHYDANVRNFN